MISHTKKNIYDHLITEIFKCACHCGRIYPRMINLGILNFFSGGNGVQKRNEFKNVIIIINVIYYLTAKYIDQFKVFLPIPYIHNQNDIQLWTPFRYMKNFEFICLSIAIYCFIAMSVLRCKLIYISNRTGC